MRKSPKMSDAESPHMAPFARLPIFISLAGKRALVAGGSAAAAWKAELLSAAGAEVDVFAPTMSEEMIAIAASPPSGPVNLHQRHWDTTDLGDAALAVGAIEDDREAAHFAATAQALKIPFNVIDKPTFCSFAFGAIVNRSPLVIGISTDGAAPVFAQAIRARIEALLPTGFARWTTAARAWRETVKQSGLSFGNRRRFWQLFAARAVNNPNRVPDSADFDLLLSAAYDEAATREHGSVALVGTGPGDPELLTLRAARALRSADVILFDDQIASDILDFSRREAKKLLVRTLNDERSDQPEISTLAVMFARNGKRVVRLMAGDPATSCEAELEIAAYQTAGIALELIPGLASPGDKASLAAEVDATAPLAGVKLRVSDQHRPRKSDPSALS
jgi:uroporphyrin-III C-methyltransferase/precorrin-2 dehydrogenase/sirohydrochlorin ferrochelatase